MVQRRLLAWTVTAVTFTLLLSASGVESRRRSQKEQPNSTTESSKNDNNDLQKEMEELLEYGSQLRWQVVDMLGIIVYDRYDEVNLNQLEVLYKIYHETLRRKLNIFEIASNLASKSGGLNAKDVCEVVNKNICVSKENSKVCKRLIIGDSRRSTNTTQDIPEAVKKEFSRGVSIPAILKEIREKNLKITSKLLAGLISNIQYDSFDNEVLRAEKTLVEYLNTLPDSTVFSPGKNLKNFVSLDLLLKALLEHNNNQFPGPAKRAALILIDHFEKDLNSINNNIEHFGIIYENSTINLKYLLELVIPDDLVDADIMEARDNLEKAMKKEDFVKNKLSIDKYRHASPDQLMLEILRQLNHVGIPEVPKNNIKALRMHADFWRKERTIDDVSDFLMLFSAYDNLRDKHEYKKFFQYVNLIKEKLKHSENVNLELTCSMPRPCLRRVLLKILECSMVDDETKKIVSNLIQLLNSRGTPIVVDRKVPDQLKQVTQEPTKDGSIESDNTSGETDYQPIHPPKLNVLPVPKIPKPEGVKVTKPDIELESIPKVEKPLSPIKLGIDAAPGLTEKPLLPSIKDASDSETVSIPPLTVDKPLAPLIKPESIGSEDKSPKKVRRPPPRFSIGESNDDRTVKKPLSVKCEGAKNCDEESTTTSLPIEKSTLPSEILETSVEGGTTENPSGSDEEITQLPEIVDETTTTIPLKTTTFLIENTKRKLSTEDILSTTPTIIKSNDHETTTPTSIIIEDEKDKKIPSESLTDKDDQKKSFEDCFKNCLKDSNEEKCEESCEKSIEKSCQGPNCPDASQSTECESGSGEDCSTESSSTTGIPSEPTPVSNIETSTEDCSDSNSENCKRKPLEKCEGPDCPTTAETCEDGNCTEESKVTSTTESAEENISGSGVVCDSHGCHDKSKEICEGSKCKSTDVPPSTEITSTEEVQNPKIDVSTEPSSVVDESDGKLCDTKDPHRQRKSERLKKLRRLNVIDAEEQALNLYDEGDGNDQAKQLNNKIEDDKKELGPLLQGLSKTQEDTAKHKIHQTELRRSLSAPKTKIEITKKKSNSKKHRKSSLAVDKPKAYIEDDDSKTASRRNDASKTSSRRNDNSKAANRRNDTPKIVKRRSSNGKTAANENDTPKRRNSDSKTASNQNDTPKRRRNDSKTAANENDSSKRRSNDSKTAANENDSPKRRSNDSKKAANENDTSKRRSNDSKIAANENDSAKIVKRRSNDSKTAANENDSLKSRSNDSKTTANENDSPKRRRNDSKKAASENDTPKRRNSDSKTASNENDTPKRRRNDSKTAANENDSSKRRSNDSKTAANENDSPKRRSNDSKKAANENDTSKRRSNDSKKAASENDTPKRRRNDSKTSANENDSPNIIKKRSNDSKKAANENDTPKRRSNDSKTASNENDTPKKRGNDSKTSANENDSPKRRSNDSKIAANENDTPKKRSNDSKIAANENDSPKRRSNDNRRNSSKKDLKNEESSNNDKE